MVFLEFISQNDDDETILITCHGGTIRTLLCKMLDIPIGHCWNFSQGNTTINRIFYNGMGPSDHNILNLLNDTAHVDNFKRACIIDSFKHYERGIKMRLDKLLANKAFW